MYPSLNPTLPAPPPARISSIGQVVSSSLAPPLLLEMSGDPFEALSLFLPSFLPSCYHTLPSLAPRYVLCCYGDAPKARAPPPIILCFYLCIFVVHSIRLKFNCCVNPSSTPSFQLVIRHSSTPTFHPSILPSFVIFHHPMPTLRSQL